MSIPITHYEAAFEPGQNKYAIKIQIGTTTPVNVPVDSIDEFNAMLIMLGRLNVLYDPATRSIFLSSRPVGS